MTWGLKIKLLESHENLNVLIIDSEHDQPTYDFIKVFIVSISNNHTFNVWKTQEKCVTGKYWCQSRFPRKFKSFDQPKNLFRWVKMSTRN